MDVEGKLSEIVAFVGSARTLPMSSSVIVNSAELTRMLEELRDLLPSDLSAAQAVLDRRDGLLLEATANAERLLEAAVEEQRKLVSDEEVQRVARAEAGEIVQAARDKSERVMREIDAYVDAKLAHLEVSVTNILDTIRHGREQLTQPGVYTELAAPNEPVEPEPAPAD